MNDVYNSNGIDSKIPVTMPVDFTERVKECLEHLFNPLFLQSNPLVFDQSGKKLSGQALRVEFIRAIEIFNPGSGVPLLSKEVRSHTLLQLRYIQKLGINEIAYTLGMSSRQVNRALRSSEEALSAILWERNYQSKEVISDSPNNSHSNSDISRIRLVLEPFDLSSILQNALTTVQNLAGRNQIKIRCQSSVTPFELSSDPILAHQTFVSILSHIIRQTMPGSTLDVLLTRTERICVEFQYIPRQAVDQITHLDEAVIQLVDRLNWRFLEYSIGGNRQNIKVEINSIQKKILIVDDNEGLVELLRRFLSKEDCTVFGTTSAVECLDLAEKLLPNAIILDVLLPEIDGWELLQRLQFNPTTKLIPTIICSVFIEPELAESLGASAFLAKPVKQAELIEALKKIGTL